MSEVTGPLGIAAIGGRLALPKIGLRTVIELIIGIGLIAIICALDVRIDGVAIGPIHVKGLESQLADARADAKQARDALAQTVAGYRAAAAQARVEDAANAARVKAQQTTISQESSDEFQARIAAARAVADQLRRQLASQGNTGIRAGAAVPGVSAAVGGSDAAANPYGLSVTPEEFDIDDRLTCSEQSVQLDELIKWVQRTHAIDVNGPKP